MDLLEKIKTAGVVGAGGAGFPTQVKLDCRADCLLVNAAECEPLLRTDKFIMTKYADEIIAATSAVINHIGAAAAHIAIKKTNEKETAAIQQAINRYGDQRIKVCLLDNYYPAGDEQMAVFDVTGRIVPPAGIPPEVGVVVSNAATMLNIHDALADVPVTHKIFTVTGLVRSPKVLRAPIGISFQECLAACGGTTTEQPNIINGGPMMGSVHDSGEIEKLAVTKTTSGIIVIPDTNNFSARQKKTPLEKILGRAKSACIQCSFCTDLCPRQLIGHKLRPHMVMRQMSAMDFGTPVKDNPILLEALICCECGICETFACPMGLSPRRVNAYIKKTLSGAGIRYQRNDQKLEASPMRQYRKIAPAKIMARMGLLELYDSKAENFEELDTDTVRIPLKQHIGASASPVVAEGEYVERGCLIAKAEGKVSANIHASIAGVIAKVGEYIEITRKNK